MNGNGIYGGGSVYRSSLNGGNYSTRPTRIGGGGGGHSYRNSPHNSANAAAIPKLEAVAAQPPYGSRSHSRNSAGSSGAYFPMGTGAVGGASSPMIRGGGRGHAKLENGGGGHVAGTKRSYSRSSNTGSGGHGGTPTKKKRQKRSRSQQRANGGGRRGARKSLARVHILWVSDVIKWRVCM